MNDNEIPRPPGIREEIFSNENLYRRYGHVVTIYDPETKLGGTYNMIEKQWALFYPIEYSDFIEGVVLSFKLSQRLIDQAKESTSH